MAAHFPSSALTRPQHSLPLLGAVRAMALLASGPAATRQQRWKSLRGRLLSPGKSREPQTRPSGFLVPQGEEVRTESPPAAGVAGGSSLGIITLSFTNEERRAFLAHSAEKQQHQDLKSVLLSSKTQMFLITP